MSAAVARVALAARTPATPAALAGRGETPLLRVAPSHLDGTYVGVDVLVTGVSADGRSQAARGGISDVLVVPAGTEVECTHGHVHTLGSAVTVLWVGGRHLVLDDDAVVLVAPPLAQLEAAALPPPR